MSAFISLPLRSIDKLSLGTRRRDIGRGEGATTSRPDVA
jgi:arsenate reductase